MTLRADLADLEGWVEIAGLGWLRPVTPRGDRGPDYWWWHECPAPDARGLAVIDCSTGERHAVLSGTLDGGDLTIGGGSGSILCDLCGLHGWVRDGRWVAA